MFNLIHIFGFYCMVSVALSPNGQPTSDVLQIKHICNNIVVLKEFSDPRYTKYLIHD